MRVQINKGAARQRWSKICNEANNSMPTKIVKRIFKDGSEQEYERKAKKISDGAQQTGHALIMYYASYYRTTTIELDAADVPAELRNDGIPSLRTNGELLAKFRENISSRTSRTHIKALIDLGLIKKKVFHGSKSRYELFFNEEILFGENSVIGTPPPVFEAPTTSNAELKFEGKNFSSTSENHTNFPHRQSLETHGNMTTTIKKVDNSIIWKQEEDNSISWKQQNGNTPLANHRKIDDGDRNGGLGAGPQKIHSYWAKKGLGVDNSVKSVDKYANGVDKPVDSLKSGGKIGSDFTRQPRIIQNAIESFGKYALKELYKDVVFTETERLKIVDLLTDSIYRPFLKTNPNEKEFNNYQRELLASVDIAAKYFANNPKRYPGRPYTTHDNWLGYFDSTNEKGFKVAMNWRFQNRAKQHDEYGKRVVNLAMLHLNRFANNEVDKLPKHLRVKTFREVFEFYKIKMLQFNTLTQELFIKRFNSIKF